MSGNGLELQHYYSNYGPYNLSYQFREYSKIPVPPPPIHESEKWKLWSKQRGHAMDPFNIADYTEIITPVQLTTGGQPKLGFAKLDHLVGFELRRTYKLTEDNCSGMQLVIRPPDDRGDDIEWLQKQLVPISSVAENIVFAASSLPITASSSSVATAPADIMSLMLAELDDRLFMFKQFPPGPFCVLNTLGGESGSGIFQYVASVRPSSRKSSSSKSMPFHVIGMNVSVKVSVPWDQTVMKMCESDDDLSIITLGANPSVQQLDDAEADVKKLASSGVDIVVGGILPSTNHSKDDPRPECARLIASILMGFKNLKKGGHFLCCIPFLHNPIHIALVFILYRHFNYIQVIKPQLVHAHAHYDHRFIWCKYLLEESPRNIIKSLTDLYECLQKTIDDDVVLDIMNIAPLQNAEFLRIIPHARKMNQLQLFHILDEINDKQPDDAKYSMRYPDLHSSMASKTLARWQQQRQ